MEIIKAFIIAGLPIAVFSFLLVLWSIHKNYINPDDSLNQLKHRKKQSDDKNSDFKLSVVHQKWLFFGGGYYGTMAFIAYIHIEYLEVVDFFSNYTSFQHLIDQLSFGAVIRLIIESFLNIIPAFLWFLHWPDFISMTNGWFWLIASFAGYHLGGYAAKTYSKREIKLW